MENAPIVLELVEPIQLKDEVITKLEFTKLKAKHLKGMSASPGFDDLLKLVSSSTGQVPGIIGEMSLEDTMKAVEIVGGFFGSGLKTGENS